MQKLLKLCNPIRHPGSGAGTSGGPSQNLHSKRRSGLEEFQLYAFRCGLIATPKPQPTESRAPANLLGNVANTSSHDSQPKTDRSSLLAQAKSTKVGLAKTWRGATRFADARPGEAQPRGTSHRTLELQCIDFFLERGDTATSCELLLQRAICPQSRHPIPSISSAMLKRQRTPSTRMKTFFSSLDQSQASSKGSTITGSCS